MDDGEVLPRLNEPWTFLGAKAMEWLVGAGVFIMMTPFGSPAKIMPFMIGGWVFTTMTLAKMREKYPDEERGLRNAAMTSMGLVPPNVPAPASLQPVWSQCRVQELPEGCKFKELGLDQVFPSFQDALMEAEEL